MLVRRFCLNSGKRLCVREQSAGSESAEQWREVKVIGLAELEDYPIMWWVGVQGVEVSTVTPSRLLLGYVGGRWYHPLDRTPKGRRLWQG